jgi:hypothetical protein
MVFSRSKCEEELGTTSSSRVGAGGRSPAVTGQMSTETPPRLMTTFTWSHHIITNN